MKTLFTLSGVVGSYSEIARIEQDGGTGDAQRFAVVMRDGHRVVSPTFTASECQRELETFARAWDASRSVANVVLEVKKLRADAKLPVRSSEGASCFDVCAVDAGTVLPGQRALVKTGLQMAIPRGFEIQVRSRSGHAAKAGVFVLNSPGTVDSDYRGEVGVILQNTGAAPFNFAAGDRIAQIAVCPVEMCAAVEVEALSETDRGAGGFGSTGVK